MLTGDIKNQVDQVWNAFWSGGISNPLEVIEQKVAGQEVAVAPRAPKGQIIDLMEALKASLEAKKAAAATEAAGAERKPAQAKGRSAAKRKAAAK